jgi:hypothetical protein
MGPSRGHIFLYREKLEKMGPLAEKKRRKTKLCFVFFPFSSASGSSFFLGKGKEQTAFVTRYCGFM